MEEEGTTVPLDHDLTEELDVITGLLGYVDVEDFMADMLTSERRHIETVEQDLRRLGAAVRLLRLRCSLELREHSHGLKDILHSSRLSITDKTQTLNTSQAKTDSTRQ